MMSYNVRVNHEQDAKNENNWKYRASKIEYVLNKYKADILALQEPNESQLSDLKKFLGSDFEWIHARASDRAYSDFENFKSEQHRETQAIAFNKNRFELLHSGMFWLAPDPTQEPTEIAWDGSPFSRVAVYTTLYDKLTQKTINIFTAHFDHKGVEARMNSVNLMVQKATEISKGAPFFITGDFNTFQNDRGPEVYAEFLKYKEVISDVRDVTKVHYGPIATWVGWDYNAFNEKKMEALCPGEPSRWDHVFLTPRGINVHRTAVADDQFKIQWEEEAKQVYPSDHRPMIVDFQLTD
jgi:endonuclease/exonuclease/phosphatase family metal-dependent hydrolase